MTTRKTRKTTIDENPWTWKGEVFDLDKFCEEHFVPAGFVYLIEELDTGKKYIGKKFFYSVNRVKVPGKKNRKVKRKESDWKSYWSSSDVVKTALESKGPGAFSRVILSIHETRADVNYGELREQVIRDVLSGDEYLNENIALRYYKRKTPHRSL